MASGGPPPAHAGHYFSTSPDVASAPRTVQVRLPDQSLVLRTDRGVFSLRGLDPGTAVLLGEIPPPPPDGTLLDLGCGHGVIAIAVARRAPAARVIAVDVNRRALELTRANSALNGAGNVEACAPEEVDASLRFDAIYSNPPIRAGRAALMSMLTVWLGRLAPGGVAHLVVQRHLGADSLAALLRSDGHAVRRAASKRGYRILDVRPGASASHDP